MKIGKISPGYSTIILVILQLMSFPLVSNFSAKNKINISKIPEKRLKNTPFEVLT
jgi:hypothetical protein